MPPSGANPHPGTGFVHEAGGRVYCLMNIDVRDGPVPAHAGGGIRVG